MKPEAPVSTEPLHRSSRQAALHVPCTKRTPRLAPKHGSTDAAPPRNTAGQHKRTRRRMRTSERVPDDASQRGRHARLARTRSGPWSVGTTRPLRSVMPAAGRRQSMRPGRSDAEVSSRHLATQAGHWSCPVFDNTWSLPVVSRGKGGSGAENEAPVSLSSFVHTGTPGRMASSGGEGDVPVDEFAAGVGGHGGELIPSPHPVGSGEPQAAAVAAERIRHHL